MNDLFSPISERSKDSSNNNTASRSLINQNNNNQQLSSLSSAWLPISSNTNFDHSGILLTPLKEEEGEGEGREEEEEDVDWDEHDLYSIPSRSSQPYSHSSSSRTPPDTPTSTQSQFPSHSSSQFKTTRQVLHPLSPPFEYDYNSLQNNLQSTPSQPFTLTQPQFFNKTVGSPPEISKRIFGSSLPSTPSHKSFAVAEERESTGSSSHTGKEIPWTWPTRGERILPSSTSIHDSSSSDWHQPTSYSRNNNALEHRFDSPTKKTFFSNLEEGGGGKMLIEDSWEDLVKGSREEEQAEQDRYRQPEDKQNHHETGLATRYIRVHNVPRDSSELDLGNLLMKRNSDVKGCYTSLLRSHGIIVLVFYDVRSALASLPTISTTSISGNGMRSISVGSSGNSSYKVLKSFCITRGSLILLNSSKPNPLLSPSEGVILLSLLPARANVNLPPFLPTSTHSSFFTQFGDVRSLRPIASNNYSRGVGESSWLIEFWDERDGEKCMKFFSEVEWTESGKLVRGSGVGVGFECHFEPGLVSTTFTQSQFVIDQVMQAQSTPRLNKSYVLPPIPQVRLPQALLRSPPSQQQQQQQQQHTQFFNQNRVSHQQQAQGHPFSNITNNSFDYDNSRKKDNFGGSGKGNHYRENSQNSWSTSAANPMNSKAIVPSPPPPSWGIYRDEKIPARNVLQLDRIEQGLDVRTTLMLKNIPNRMTDVALMEYIDEAVGKRAYDFFYLRIDFSTECTVGYGFVNFVDIDSLLKFAKARLGTRWNLYSSDKICVASYANIQGKENLVSRFKNSSIMEEVAAFRPKIFYSNGHLVGQPESFPPSDDPHRKARSASNTSSSGLFPSHKPVFKVTHALKGLHM